MMKTETWRTWSQIANNLEISILDFISDIAGHAMPDDGDGDVVQFISENFPRLREALEDYGLKVVGDKDYWKRAWNGR